MQHSTSKKVRKSLVLDQWEKEEVGAQVFTEDNSLDVQVSIKLLKSITGSNINIEVSIFHFINANKVLGLKLD